MATAIPYDLGLMTPASPLPPRNSLLPPMVRSPVDVALWFQDQEGAGRLSARKLHCLLYLAQAYFAAAQDGRALMPASFHAAAEGPFEPTVALVLECGLARPPTVEIPPRIEAVLAALWQQYGRIPGPGLARLIAADGIWKSCRESNPDGLIPLDALGAAYGAAMTADAVPAVPPEPTEPAEIAAALAAARATAMAVPEPADGPAEAANPTIPAAASTAATEAPQPSSQSPDRDAPQASKLPPVERIRFTIDGREITPWIPRRRLPA